MGKTKLVDTIAIERGILLTMEEILSQCHNEHKCNMQHLKLKCLWGLTVSSFFDFFNAITLIRGVCNNHS